MSTRDINSDLNVIVASTAPIAADGTSYSSGIDIADYDDGFLAFGAIPDWVDGTYVMTLQDSPDDSVWTDVPTNKLIDPAGNGSITLTGGTAAEDELVALGAFSVNKYIRIKIVASLVTSGATVTSYVIRKADLKPAV